MLYGTPGVVRDILPSASKTLMAAPKRNFFFLIWNLLQKVVKHRFHHCLAETRKENIQDRFSIVLNFECSKLSRNFQRSWMFFQIQMFSRRCKNPVFYCVLKSHGFWHMNCHKSSCSDSCSCPCIYIITSVIIIHGRSHQVCQEVGGADVPWKFSK